MRDTTNILLTLLAGIVLLGFGDRHQVQGEEIKLEMPKEAFGFSGTLSAEVVKEPDKTYGWFQIRVVKVIGFSRNNKSKLRTPQALTKLWKGKCVAVLGVKGMAELKVGDMVTIVAAAHEVHLRATKVTKDKPVEAKPDGELGTPQKQRQGLAPPDRIERAAKEPLVVPAGPADLGAGPRLLEKLRTAPANSWIEVPNSPLIHVVPSPASFPRPGPPAGQPR